MRGRLTMKDIILEELKKIEEENDVKILYACESGSRAWGFPSKDSDYDVRFIYIHKKEYYLTIDPVGIGTKRDVIERPINDLLDISGWDLTKTLRLLRKSNPPLLEWMRSDILYYQAFSTINKMRALEKDTFYPNASLYHYLNMAKNNYREYLQSDLVKIKKYFYVLRPILACKWIEKYNTIPPISFHSLLDDIIPSGELRLEIDQLLKRKIAGDEMDLEPKISLINEFLDTEITKLEVYTKSLNIQVTDPTEKLDRLFLETLDEVWD